MVYTYIKQNEVALSYQRWFTIEQTAKYIGIERQRLNELLKKENMINENGEPMVDYILNEVLKYDSISDDEGSPLYYVMETKVSRKGLDFIKNLNKKSVVIEMNNLTNTWKQQS